MSNILDFFRRKKPPTPPAPVTFEDNFDKGVLDTTNWGVSTWGAPLGGMFSAANVDLSQKCLALKLWQNPVDLSSFGAELTSRRTFGFGTYEFLVRVGSTATTPDGPGASVSGGVSGLFNFVNNSETEIDIEATGDVPNSLWFSTWHGLSEHHYIQDMPPFNPASGFHRYVFKWEPAKVTFSIDGVLMWAVSDNVPQTPAYVIINHWGTNTTYWGGYASPGIDRFMYVRQFRYTSL